MSQYKKTCTFCKEEIEMSDKDGKWRAYNLNNGLHNCKKQKQNNHSNGNNDISLDVLLKRLASFGISIDLEKFRNVK